MRKENLKSKIIPENIKENIDEVLEEQLFNANRYYAESNANIYELMQIEMSYWTKLHILRMNFI